MRLSSRATAHGHVCRMHVFVQSFGTRNASPSFSSVMPTNHIKSACELYDIKSRTKTGIVTLSLSALTLCQYCQFIIKSHIISYYAKHKGILIL